MTADTRRQWHKTGRRCAPPSRSQIARSFGIARINRQAFLTKEKSVRALQAKLGLMEIKGASDTPMDSSVKLTRADCPTEDELRTRKEATFNYQSCTESLCYYLYVMWTRPDCAYVHSAFLI